MGAETYYPTVAPTPYSNPLPPAYGTPLSYCSPGPGQPSAFNANAGAYYQPWGSYVRADPVPVKGPMDSVLQNLGKLGKQAENFVGNVWSHLKTGPSLSDTAWGKLNHGTKLLCEGGLENIFRTNFEVAQSEQLRKSYACYLSTSTGPVAGTLFISTFKLAFCSDRPLLLGYSAGKEAWSYYKVVIPLESLKSVRPSANNERPAERYIQVVTVDNREFWFMGFVNYEKGLYNLQQAVPFRGSK